MIPHPVGPSLFQVPAFGLAHVTSKIANLFGADIASHGYTMWHQRFVFLLSTLAGLGAVWLAFLAAKQYMGGHWAPLYAAISVCLGTSLTLYATYAPSYAHALDAFFCSSFLAYWAKTYGSWRWKRFVVLGILLGLAALIRVTGFGLGVVLLVEVLFQLAKKPSDEASWPRYAAKLFAMGSLSLGVAVLVFAPQLIAWKVVFGDWYTSPMGPKFMRLSDPEWVEVLFASRNGWLSTHPIAYAGVLGLFFVPRRLRPLALGLGAAVIIQVYVNSCVFDWWSGSSFGQRRLCSLTFVLVFGLTALLRAAGLACARLPRWSRHGLVVLVFGWFIVWNLAQVERHRLGKAANISTHAMCCGSKVPKTLQKIAKPIYNLVGNPFSWPASALFAYRFNTSLQAWDLVAGNYVDHPDLRKFNIEKHRISHGWNLANRYVTGFGPLQKHKKKRFRWTTETESGVVLPLFIGDEARTIELLVSPNRKQATVRLSLNGTTYVEQSLAAGWNKLAFTVPASGLHRGMNHLVVHSVLGPSEASPATLSLPPPPKASPIGVAISGLRIGYAKAQ